MARDGDDFREAQTDNILCSERRGEVPHTRRWRISKELQLAFGKNETSSGIALPGHSRTPRWFPAIESHGDADFVRGGPFSHRSRGQQVAQSTVECHRGNNHDTRLFRRATKSFKGSEGRGLLGGHIQIVNARTQRCFDYRHRGIQKRPSAINDSRSAIKRTVERPRGVSRCWPHVESRIDTS